MVVHEITCPKIAGLEPSWTDYRGFSILFDNPGSEPDEDRIQELGSIPVRRPEAQRVFDRLAAAVDDLDPTGLRDHLGFCPLPRATYHVTICDGITEHDLANCSHAPRPATRAFLRDLPNGLHHPPPAVRHYLDHDLTAVTRDNPVTFRVTGLSIWGHVLVARLGPVGTADEQNIEEITRARDALATSVQARLGVDTQPWQPHVSLGYFANQRNSERAGRHLRSWEQTVLGELGDHITFRQTALYGFTNMVTYFRQPTSV